VRGAQGARRAQRAGPGIRGAPGDPPPRLTHRPARPPPRPQVVRARPDGDLGPCHAMHRGRAGGGAGGAGAAGDRQGGARGWEVGRGGREGGAPLGCSASGVVKASSCGCGCAGTAAGLARRRPAALATRCPSRGRRRLASRTSARRRCCGVAARASRCTTRSCGSTTERGGGPGGVALGSWVAAVGGQPSQALPQSSSLPSRPRPSPLPSPWPPSSEICARLAESLPGGKDHFRPITGLPISTYFSAYKVQWLLENVPAVSARAVVAITIPTTYAWPGRRLDRGAGAGGPLPALTRAAANGSGARAPAARAGGCGAHPWVRQPAGSACAGLSPSPPHPRPHARRPPHLPRCAPLCGPAMRSSAPSTPG
jgi:hypothetical protein